MRCVYSLVALHIYLLTGNSPKRIPEPAAVREGDGKCRDHKHQRETDGDIVVPFQAFSHVPGAFFVFAETAQLHGVADDVNPVEAGKQKREDDRTHVFDAAGNGSFIAHLNAARLLRMPDFCEVGLHVRYVAQRNCDGIANVVADAEPVQARRKLAGVRRHDKHEHHRRHGEIFEHDIEFVKKLLGRDIMIAGNFYQKRLCPINLRALVRGEQPDREQVQAEEQHNKHKHRADLLPFRL